MLVVDAFASALRGSNLDGDPLLQSRDPKRLCIGSKARNLLFSDYQYLVREENETTGLRASCQLTQVAGGCADLFLYRHETYNCLASPLRQIGGGGLFRRF